MVVPDASELAKNELGRAALNPLSPWPILSGPQLTLRALEMGDVDAWMAGDDAEQQRWFEAPGPSPRTNVVAAISHWRRNWETSASKRHWGIRVNGILAGGIDVENRGEEAAYLSYVVFPAFRRRGLAVEAIELVRNWAMGAMPVTSMVAVIDELNAASRATVERTGFVLEGPARPDEFGESGVMLRYRWIPAPP